eukprot:CAMPEP_0119560070 /NCGR_PEP_ID=MMETSP1352-20130426/13920_1 /TAXON_ID=265584 /ORGANISM="Stauroneis constricta, Strain CCMP1120" /LENGTH=289 /DNA_ID=CAMNT_0007607955 /DNA_START=178 /DNA_END=1044 /DNA_ORIENTATION=+
MMMMMPNRACRGAAVALLLLLVRPLAVAASGDVDMQLHNIFLHNHIGAGSTSTATTAPAQPDYFEMQEPCLLTTNNIAMADGTHRVSHQCALTGNDLDAAAAGGLPTVYYFDVPIPTMNQRLFYLPGMKGNTQTRLLAFPDDADIQRDAVYAYSDRRSGANRRKLFGAVSSPRTAVVVLVTDSAGAVAPGHTAAQLREIFFGTSSLTFIQQYRDMSFGQLVISAGADDGTGFNFDGGLAEIMLDVAAATLTSTKQIATAIDNKMAETDTSWKNLHHHFIFIVPPGTTID